jgi:hypothetical protein
MRLTRAAAELMAAITIALAGSWAPGPSPSSAEAGRAHRAGPAALYKAANPECLFRPAD